MGVEGTTGHVFTNWAQTFSCKPQLYFEPTNVDEIRAVLKKATADNKRVKICGIGHSPSDLACTDDYLICLTKYNRILQIDSKNYTVTVEGGLELNALNDVLTKNGMAMKNIPCVADITVAGMIATASHGSGVNYGITSDYVLELDLMLANGEVMRCSKQENPDTFKAALVSLGALGIILTLKIQCEPSFRLSNVSVCKPFEEAIAELETEIHKSDHFRMQYYPHVDQMVCYHTKRSNKPISAPESWFWDTLIGFYLYQIGLYVAIFFPPFVTLVNKLHHLIFNKKPVETCNVSHKILTFDCLFSQYVMEWSIPRKDTETVLRQLREQLPKLKLYVHFPVEIRFSKADDIYLSPSYNQDSCWINILLFRPFHKDPPGRQIYWDCFEKIVKSVGGRPHWAKEHRITPDEFRKLYPKFDTFLEIREKLDPNGVFLNDYLERHLLGTKPISI